MVVQHHGRVAVHLLGLAGGSAAVLRVEVGVLPPLLVVINRLVIDL